MLIKYFLYAYFANIKNKSIYTMFFMKKIKNQKKNVSLHYDSENTEYFYAIGKFNIWGTCASIR